MRLSLPVRKYRVVTGDAGLGGPLDEVVLKCGGQLADGDGTVFGFDLTREGGEGGRGLAVGGAEEEASEDDAVLHIDPDKAASTKVGAALAGEEDIAVIANLDRDLGVGEDVIQRVGEGHVASVMEHAVGNVGSDDVFELVVAVEIARGRAVELGEEGKRGGGDAVLEEIEVEGRWWREGNGWFGGRLRLLRVGGRGWSFLGRRRVGGGNGLGGQMRGGDDCSG
jgi:hypothetical protein